MQCCDQPSKIRRMGSVHFCTWRWERSISPGTRPHGTEWSRAQACVGNSLQCFILCFCFGGPLGQTSPNKRTCLKEKRLFFRIQLLCVNAFLGRRKKHPELWAFIDSLLGRTLGHLSWLICPSYAVPSDRQVGRLVDEMASEIQALLRVKMAQWGPWFLTADGATSKGRSLYTFDIVNANDEHYHLALLDGGAQRLDSPWLNEQLRSMAERVPNLCGVSQVTKDHSEIFAKILSVEIQADGLVWRMWTVASMWVNSLLVTWRVQFLGWRTARTACMVGDWYNFRCTFFLEIPRCFLLLIWNALACWGELSVDAYCNKRGAYAALAFPKWDSSRQEVLAFFRIGQPSHLLAKLGLHLGTCAGSQEMSERSWARLTRQCVPIRANLTADTKTKLMQLATNWSLLYPDVFLKWQKKRISRKRKYRTDFVILPRPAGRRGSGPAAPPNGDAQTENPPDPDASDDDLESTSSSTSNSDSNAGLALSDNEWAEDRIITTIILLMDRIMHQLRLVVYPIMYKVLTSHGAGFLPSTVGSQICTQPLSSSWAISFHDLK